MIAGLISMILGHRRLLGMSEWDARHTDIGIGFGHQVENNGTRLTIYLCVIIAHQPEG